MGDPPLRVLIAVCLVRRGAGHERAMRDAQMRMMRRLVSYGSSRACNATSVGSPADSRSPVALRGPARAGFAVSWRGRFPAGDKRSTRGRALDCCGSARRASPDTSHLLVPFGNPANSRSPVALRIPLARGLPVRCELCVQLESNSSACAVSPEIFVLTKNLISG